MDAHPFFIELLLSSNRQINYPKRIQFIFFFMRNSALWLLLMIPLVSCRVGPQYESPCTEIPEGWKGPSSTHEVNVDEWWEVFEDDKLNELEQLLLENNPTLYVALERVVEARALAGVVGADLYPQISLNPRYTSTGRLIKIPIPVTILPNVPKVFRVHEMEYVLPLNLIYELDLWGRLRDQADSAILNAQAEAEAFEVTRLTLTSDLATNYFQMRGFDTQMNLLQSTIDTRKRNLEIVKSRFNKGLVTQLDLHQATLELANAESDYFDALRLRRLAENQIAILTGQPPALFCIEHIPLYATPVQVPVGLPSEVLLQRPDIAEAERDMAAQHMLVDAAYASFFPSLNLTGTLGFSSPDLKHFLKWKSRLWQIGVQASQPIFEGGRLISNLDLEWARFDQASGTYQQRVLTAFQEVEDALNNLEMEEKRWEKLNIAASAAKESSRMVNRRYTSGITTYLDVVSSERFELQAELSLIRVLALRYVYTVQLIKAIGGGWDSSLCEDLN